MYRYQDIRRVHLELTTRCNAVCPMCSRNVRGGFQTKHLPEAELSLEDIVGILPATFVSQLEQIWLCGNYGDPIVARDTLAILHYFRRSNPALRIGFNTNGSARELMWWRELAGLVSVCQFGIDGLEDTNHLYRRNTSWSLIMRNAKAFIAAGGEATWEFIAFRHNEHQIDNARELAQDMGFKRFRVRKTGRFFHRGALRASLAVLDQDGRFQYNIEPPINDSLLNTESLDLGTMAAQKAYQAYLDSTCIDCKAQREAEVYISAEGLVLPCCYLGNFYRERDFSKKTQFQSMLDHAGGRSLIDGRRRSVAEIVSSRLFQEDVPESWLAESVQSGKLATCSATCGRVSPSKGQYTKSLI